MNFSLASGRRILKRNTDRRISEEAAEELIGALEEYGDKLAREANDMAKHAERRTIKKEDVRLSSHKIRL